MEPTNPLIIRADGSFAGASPCVLLGPGAGHGAGYNKAIYTESLRKGHWKKRKKSCKKYVTGDRGLGEVAPRAISKVSFRHKNVTDAIFRAGAVTNHPQ